MISRTSLLASALLLLLAPGASAQDAPAVKDQPIAQRMMAIPTQIPFQGYLTDDLGAPIDQTVSMSVSLYDAASAGTLVWGPEAQSVVVDGGIFNVVIGSVVALDPADFTSGGPLFLSVAVDGGAEMLPRHELASVPYSIAATNGGAGGSAWTESGSDVYRASGNVGIGTSSPTYPLDVDGDARVRNGKLRIEHPTDPAEWMDIDWFNDQARIRMRGSGGAADNGFAVHGPNESKLMRITNNAWMSIGHDSPTTHLDVWGHGKLTGNMVLGENLTVGDKRFASHQITMHSSTGDWYIGNNAGGNGTSNNQLFFSDGSGGVTLSLQKSTKRVGIGTDQPATALDVNGAITIRGGADIVEGFNTESGGEIEAGTVMAIDAENPGKLRPSDAAYDATVAGVVSGAGGVQPGIKLGQDGVMDGNVPVAMSGRVYVKCSAENGPIRPGDRLTTSTTSGHAMVATDRDLADGAVIGKAMSSLDAGTGLVLVLVNLQ